MILKLFALTCHARKSLDRCGGAWWAVQDLNL